MSPPSWKRLSLKWGLLIFSSGLLGSVYVTRVVHNKDRVSANHSHVVKTIVMPSRMELATNNLQTIFEDMEMIRAFEKENADLEMMESAKLLDRSWDSDGKLRDIYSVSYPKEGEVSCTMSHRRVLEGFLSSEAETMLVLEDDAVAMTEDVSQEIEEVLKVAPKGWDYINLGRCWDVCDARRKQVVASFNVSNAEHLSKKGTLEKSLGWEMCTHAYLVSRAGAEKLLQYTQPILLPYDHTVNILGRQGHLDVYFTSPRLFTQSEDTDSMLRSKEDNVKPVCDPNGDKRAKALETEVPFYDRYIMAKINRSPVQNMVSIETMLLQEAKTPDVAEDMREKLLTNLCSRGKDEFCVRTTQVQREIAQHCSIHGGMDAPEPDEASMELLDELDRAGLDGVVIWGLRPEEGHSHRYVHSAIHRAVEYALDRSPVPRHLCYLKETPGIDLGNLLYRDSSRGKLARSLVFTSPKHMTWSNDMGFLTLPIEESSLYVFHGMTPRPHEALKEIGRAVEWETWGPDGHIPVFDSQEFVRGDVWRPHDGCNMDDEGKHFECAQERLIVMPWATEFLPTEIEENKQRIELDPVAKDEQEGMHYVGTIWYCNLEQFVGFTRGCLQENVTVTRHGKFMLSKSIEELKELPNFEMVDDLDDMTVEEVFQESNSAYAPAFQGSCHLDSNGGQSYIADRLLNVIAMGMYPMTNNPAAMEFLGNSPAIVFSEDEEDLCRAAGHHETDPEALPNLMDLVAKDHTYMSRLSTILRFFRGPIKSSQGPLIENRAHLEGPTNDQVAVSPIEGDLDVDTERKLALQPADEGFNKDELHEFDAEAEDLDERDLYYVPSTMGSMPSLSDTSDEGKKNPWKRKKTKRKYKKWLKRKKRRERNEKNPEKYPKKYPTKKKKKSGTTRSPNSTSPSDDPNKTYKPSYKKKNKRTSPKVIKKKKSGTTRSPNSTSPSDDPNKTYKPSYKKKNKRTAPKDTVVKKKRKSGTTRSPNSTSPSDDPNKTYKPDYKKKFKRKPKNRMLEEGENWVTQRRALAAPEWMSQI